MFLSEWREFPSAPCLRGGTWWQLASRCCWNRAHPWNASEFASFLVGLRTYQHRYIRALYVLPIFHLCISHRPRNIKILFTPTTLTALYKWGGVCLLRGTNWVYVTKMTPCFERLNISFISSSAITLSSNLRSNHVTSSLSESRVFVLLSSRTFAVVTFHSIVTAIWVIHLHSSCSTGLRTISG